MKNTSEMTNEELNEAVALAQGWFIYTHKNTNIWCKNGCGDPPDRVCNKAEWQPAADTIEGKAQCFDLMIKYGFTPLKSNDEWTIFPNRYTGVNGKSLQRTICEAVVLIKSGGKDE